MAATQSQRWAFQIGRERALSGGITPSGRELGDENPFDQQPTTVNIGCKQYPDWQQAHPGMHFWWQRGYEQGLKEMDAV